MNQEKSDQIKAFLRGELSEKERDAFVLKIESDTQLADQVRQQQQALQTQRLARRLFLPVSIAAGIFLIGIVVIVSRQQPTFPLPVWAEAFAILDPGLNDTGRSPAFEQAMNSYKQTKYSDALAQFQAIPPRSIGSDTSAFYIAQCYFGLGEWEACKNTLTQITPSSTLLENKIDWYAALCELGIDESKGVEMLLLIQAKENHLFQKQATELLEARL